MYVLIVCVLMVYTAVAALDRTGVCQLRDFALFIYSVQHGRKFLWLLGLYTLYIQQAHHAARPSSAHLTSPVIVHQ